MLRRRSKVARDPIKAFWAWWAEARPRVEAAIAGGGFETLAAEFSKHVQAIHPELAWELGKGRRAEHMLCVTPEGNPELRATSERWRRGGPPADATWEYAAARPSDPEALENTLTIEGFELKLAETRIGVVADDERQLMDVVVHHPSFASMPEQVKQTVSFLALDWLLGEDGVERWIGSVGVADEAPPDSLPADAVTEVLSALMDRHREPTWALLRGDGPDGRPVIVLARRPLKRVEHPLFDLHGAIELPFSEQTPEGLPAPPALDCLRAFEDELELQCGNQILLLAAHETSAGTRTLHVYADSQGEGPGVVEAFVSSRRWPAATVKWTMDPAWTAIQSYC